ncbi:protein kinase domain-containing protein [Citrus sinensis]|nr:protein kinase domain-containing protein [Citrus sinensis]
MEKTSTESSPAVIQSVQSDGVFNAGIILTETNYDDALSKAFYDGSDELQVFTLNQKVFSTKQNGQPLSKFYGELIEIFRELDHRDKVVMKDPEDVVIYRRSVERLRVHIFLAGLDEEFDQAEISEDTFGEHNNSDTTAIENESHEEIPNQLSAEDVPTTSPIRRILPQHQNRGIPKPTYDPDFSSRVKYPMSHFVSNHHLSESNQSFVNQLSTVSIPNSVHEALKDPKCKAAMNDEMRSLQKNQTWELVDLPPGKKPVGCRWIYNIKYKADGSIERYKAKLVAKGYTQTYGIDYTDTMKWTRTTQSESMQIEEIIVRVEAIPKSMVREIHKGYVTGNDEEEREALQKYLLREFEMKDLDKGRYQRLIGRLMYLSRTRPNLAYALSVVSQFMHNPGEQHMKAVMRILRYLKTNPGKGILFSKNEDYSNVEVYTDADWVGSISDRRFTSGYFTFVGGNLVTWRSKKQHAVARSSAEAEYRGMALGVCEGLWISFILNDLGYPSQQPIQLYCDNKAAPDIAHNPVQHD